MANASSLVFAGIAPHPPIMVPEVGREATAEVRSSIDAMANLTQRIVDSGAETVILISPHAPLQAAAFVAYDGPQLYGDFANFRAPTATAHADLDGELLDRITKSAAAENLLVMKINGHDLDHGTAVPLYFLQHNGWQGKAVALGYSFLSNDDHVRFGRCINKAIAQCGRSVAFIASGDLSHRLKPGAPAGYNAEAHLFDEEIVEAIRSGSTERIVNIDQNLRRIAGECGYRSMLVALGLIGTQDSSPEVLSYEAPFGVGYLVAQLSRVASQVTELDRAVPALARRTIETFVNSGTVIDAPDDLPKELNARAGCFVSIKTRNGELRGCIGTIEPVKQTLALEIIANGISAATRDPRFSPVQKEELANLKYSVDVLSSPEPCTMEDLDPAIYGVIIEDEAGRRGLLLPNLEGVPTVQDQVEIAARKAGILPGEPMKLSRFSSQRFSED